MSVIRTSRAFLPHSLLVSTFLLVGFLLPTTVDAQSAFVRGDANDDGLYDIADGIFVLGFLFSGGTAPGCADAADANADGLIDIADPVSILGTLFDGGPPPPAPHPGCGTAAPLLGCASYTSCGACCLPDLDACTITSELDCLQAGGSFAGGGTDCTDTDGDRIPDVFELGDCAGGDACTSGSSPLLADTDGDGISDGDEFYGTLDGLDLPAMGLDPCRRDILVEVDRTYTSGQSEDRNQLHPAQVARVVAAFAAAGTPNPDGSLGITLHVDTGQPPYSGGNAILDSDDILEVNSGFAGGDYAAFKAQSFAANRHGYFHYCLMVDRYSSSGVYVNSSGLGELGGDDFIVSMGQWTIGNDDFIGNTFMHELGHNLDLRHGGFQGRNFKPNYNSVMNYAYQFCGTDLDGDSIPDGGLDFSRGNLATLDESALEESTGITGFGPGIDWNGDGDTTDILARNINCRVTSTFANSSCNPLLMQTRSCGVADTCWDDLCNLLEDHDDWGALQLDVLDDNDIAPPPVIHCTVGP